MLEALLAAAFGAAGYLIARFAIEPIERYRDVRHGIASDLVLYANAISPMSAPGKPDPDVQERKAANRRKSAELHAVLVRLPRPYRWFLAKRGEQPHVAATRLIGLSNTEDLASADKAIEAIRAALRLPRVS